MKKRNLLILMLCFVMVFTVACGKKEEEKTLKMGFVPLVDGDKLIDNIQPLADILTEEMGVKVEAFTATNYVGVVEGLGSGSVDFGIIPPFACVLANNESGAEVLLTSINKDGEPGYYSEVLVRKDSGINSIEDLKGKKIAFVDPSSTSGYIFPGAYLKDHGIDLEKDIEYVYSGGHDKSLQLILNKDVDAIATFEAVGLRYQDEFPTAEEDLKSLFKSEMIPGISVTVSSSMDEATKNKLGDVLEHISENEDAIKIFEDHFGLYGFQKANIDDYDKVRKVSELMDVDLSK